MISTVQPSQLGQIRRLGLRLQRLPTTLSRRNAYLKLTATFQRTVNAPHGPTHRRGATAVRTGLVSHLGRVLLQRGLLVRYQVHSSRSLSGQYVSRTVHGHLVSVNCNSVRLNNPYLADVTVAGSLETQHHQLNQRHNSVSIHRVNVQGQGTVSGDHHVKTGYPIKILLHGHPRPVRVALPGLRLKPMFQAHVRPQRSHL